VLFPIYVNTNVQDCRFWTSSVSIFNPHATPTTVAYSAYDSAGTLVDSGSTLIGPFINAAVQVRRTGPAWVKLTSSDSIIAREFLQVLDGCPAPAIGPTLGAVDVRTRIDLPPATLARHHFVNLSFSKEGEYNTGLAIAFPSTAGVPTKGKFIHRNADGAQVSEKEVVLSPNGQLVGMISDLLPDSLKVANDITGSLEISFDADVMVAALFFGWKQTLEENVLSSMSGAIQ
jgi:hypothetical protein